MPKTAVNIVTYNNSATIAATLESLLAQTSDFSVLVIDNASTDDTPAIVEQYGVRLHINGRNTGYAAAHNQAIAMTASDYVLTLNPDVKLLPGFIDALAAALDADVRLGSVAGCLLRVDSLSDAPTVIDSMGAYMRRNQRQGLRGDGAPITERDTAQTPIFGPDGAAAFYRRAMLEDIAYGGQVFDEDFFMHKEDIDICYRAQLYGWRSAYVPDAVAHHVRHFRPGRRRQVQDDLRYIAVRNRYLLMLKTLPTALFWRNALPIVAYDAQIVIYILLLERSSLRALREAWQMRGAMFVKRREIQSRRQISDDDLRAWFT